VAGCSTPGGASLAGALSGGHASAVIARGTGTARLVHREFAHGLDLTFVVAAGFGLVAGIVVLAFVRAKPNPRTDVRPISGAAPPDDAASSRSVASGHGHDLDQLEGRRS
jgi:hypothetical protein